jgi:hypothetical protein
MQLMHIVFNFPFFYLKLAFIYFLELSIVAFFIALFISKNFKSHISSSIIFKSSSFHKNSTKNILVICDLYHILSAIESLKSKLKSSKLDISLNLSVQISSFNSLYNAFS